MKNTIRTGITCLGLLCFDAQPKAQSSDKTNDRDNNTPQVHLQCGLLAYWKLDEATGVRQDATARHLDLASYNGVSSASGILNNAGLFNAVWPDQGLHTTGTNAQTVLAFCNNWTVSAWVNHTNMNHDADNIFTKFGEVFLFVENYNTNEHFHVYVYSGGSPTNTLLVDHQFSSYVLPHNSWHHVVLRREDASIDLFIDGQLRESVAVRGTIQNHGDDFWIGMEKNGWPWNGMIDEVGYWGRSLASAEISTLYGSGTPPAFSTFTP